MMPAELSVWGVEREKHYTCIMRDKQSHNETDTFDCEIQNPPVAEFQQLMVSLKVTETEQARSYCLKYFVVLKLQSSKRVFVRCKISFKHAVIIGYLQIKYGDETVTLHLKSSFQIMWVLLLLLPIPCIISEYKKSS